MYIVYFRRKQWSVGFRYSSGEIHYVAAYSDKDQADTAAIRMNGNLA